MNPTEVVELTDQQLLDINATNPELRAQVKSIYAQKLELLSGELQKIDSFLSDFTNRMGVLTTIAGLLAFLPPLALSNEGYLTHFLIWTFPFLLLSLFCYFFSAQRIQSVMKGARIDAEGTAQELMRLRDRVKYLERVWTDSLTNYDKVLDWSRYASASIYIYIISLSVNFYLFVFFDTPSFLSSIVLLLSLFLLFIWMILRAQLKSQKNLSIGDFTGDLPMGGGAA